GETLPAVCLSGFGNRIDLAPGLFLTRAGARLHEAGSTVRVVKVQNGSLSVAIRAAVAVRMEIVAFNFGGTAVIRTNDERNGAATRRHRRGEIVWYAVNVVLRHFAERKNPLFRATAAAAGQAKTREHEGGGHDLDEMPAGNRVRPFACAFGKFALHPLMELRR